MTMTLYSVYSTMKILITGASGLLGRELKRELEVVPKWKVVGTAFKRASSEDNNLVTLDLRDKEAVNSLVKEFTPNVVVHAAAERNYGTIAKHAQEARELNVDGTKWLAEAVEGCGGFMLYISTNLVFDGTSAPYVPTDTPKPANQYGDLKLAGEQVVRETCSRWGVLRLPMLYGEVEYAGESGPTSLLDIVRDASKNVLLSNRERKYPTCTRDVAVVCKQMLQKYEEDNTFSGLWHWSGNECYTKFEMAVLISQLFSLPMSHVTGSSEPVGRHYQPYDCRLDCSALEVLGIGQRSQFRDALKPCLEPFLNLNAEGQSVCR